MGPLTFRIKLLLAMMAVVAGITVATLVITHGQFQETYRAFFERQFTSQVAFWTRLQKTRLSYIADRCGDLARVRLRGLMRRYLESGAEEEFKDAAAKLYEVADDELALVLKSKLNPEAPQQTAFLRFLDDQGRMIESAAGRSVGPSHPEAEPRFKRQLERLGRALKTQSDPQIGYLALHQSRLGADADGSDTDAIVLLEVVSINILEPSGEFLGAFVLGFPMPDPAATLRRARSDFGGWEGAILLEGALLAGELPASLRRDLLPELIKQTGFNSLGNFSWKFEGVPHRIFYQALNADSVFPTAYQVSVYSMAEAAAEQKNLQTKIMAFAGGSLAVALALSLLLSHGLTVPIRELVQGTREIQQGRYDVQVAVRSKDDLGQLATSFNEMAEGLALKEKYRNVLNMVADREVADELIHGRVALGGELREVSILFCDIRGFTALTEGMHPQEVIQFLNEHMTILTRVVYEHFGVVDKFVGDLIMAVFGAPKSYGQDPLNAARCALRMIEERARLNESSRHKIEIGIGIATGSAVAGCMGAADRLNYTVVGEKVNLASRLCGQAGRMQIVVDAATQARVAQALRSEPMAELQLKGFRGPVQAFRIIGTEPIIA